MTKKLFFSGIISVLLIFAFLAGCNNGTTEYVTVTQEVPGPVTTTTAPPITVTVTPPGSSFSALTKALVDAQDIVANDTTGKERPLVIMNGQIPVQGNTSIVVPDKVTLEIPFGSRLTVEANALLFVRPQGRIIVKGDLYFEKYAQGDDVRQAKIVGDIDVDGGTVYDKTDEAVQIQYVSKITNGGILKYGGGTVAGGVHEKFFLGPAPTFTGDGYIKLAFSDGWSKYNPVQVDTPNDKTLLTQDTATPAGGNNPIPSRLVGFEVHGKIQITGQMILPDSVLENRLFFTVKEGAELTIAAGGVLQTETNVDGVGCAMVVEDKAKVVVDGFLGWPKWTSLAAGEGNKNYGIVTINPTGTLQVDQVSLDDAFVKSNFGEIVAKGGSKILWNRSLLPAPSVFLSTGTSALGLQTSGKADVSFTKTLWKISGSGVKDTVIIKANPAWAESTGVLPFLFVLLADLEVSNVQVTVKTTLTGSASGVGEVFVTNKGKLIVEVPFAAENGTLDKKIGGVTVTGEGSEFVSANADVIFDTAYPLLLNPGTKGTFIDDANAGALDVSLAPDGVTANKALIAYEGSSSYTAGAAATVTGYDVSFDKDLTLAGDVTLTNANLTVAGTVDGGTHTWSLASSTATLNNVNSALTSGTAFTLGGASIVTIKGKLDFTADGALAILLNDGDSKLVGAVNGVSKIVKSGDDDLTYTTASNTAFKALFAPVTGDSDTIISRVIPTTESITWTDGKWGEPK